MRFTFENTKPTMSDAEVLADIQRVARELGASELPIRLYRKHGAYSATAVKDRFGSWNKAVEAAGLGVVGERDLSDEALFDNLREVWIKLGRQPRASEMVKATSRYTRHPYKRRFNTWLGAMKAFVTSVNQSGTDSEPAQGSIPLRGPRDASLRLRFLIMRRDSFKCRLCGRSPATDPAVQLHVATLWRGRRAAQQPSTTCRRCAPPAIWERAIFRNMQANTASMEPTTRESSCERSKE